jgi:hypothetical protein
MVVPSSQIKLKDLGVPLDPDLSFDEYIKNILTGSLKKNDIKVLLLTYKALLGLAPTHLSNLVLNSSVGPMIECNLAQRCESEWQGTGATNQPCCLCLAGSPLSTGILCL